MGKQNFRNKLVTDNRDFLQDKLFLEFGVMQGHSLVDFRSAYMSNDINAEFYGFDSFEGLPEEKLSILAQSLVAPSHSRLDP